MYALQPLVHNDIKPANCLIVHARLVLTDFGISGCHTRSCVVHHSQCISSRGGRHHAGVPWYLWVCHTPGASRGCLLLLSPLVCSLACVGEVLHTANDIFAVARVHQVLFTHPALASYHAGSLLCFLSHIVEHLHDLNPTEMIGRCLESIPGNRPAAEAVLAALRSIWADPEPVDTGSLLTVVMS